MPPPRILSQLVASLRADSPQPMRALVLGAMLLSVVTTWSLATFMIVHSRQQHEERAELAAQNLAGAAAHGINANVEKIDLVVTLLVDHLQTELEHLKRVDGVPSSEVIDRDRTNRLLTAQIEHRPELEGIRITDEFGRGFLGPALDKRRSLSFADRDWFIRQRDEPHLGLYMSRPLRSKIHGQWIVSFSKRYNWPDGRFAGAVTASVPLYHFDKMLAPVNVGTQGALTLRNTALELLARNNRNPAMPAHAVGHSVVSDTLRNLVASNVDQAVYRTTATADGVPRTTALKRVATAPMIVTVGLAPDDYLSAWRTEVQQVVALCAISTVLSGLAAMVLLRLLQQHRNAQGRIALLARVMERSGEAIVVSDADRHVIAVNPAFEAQSGFAAAETLGQRTREVVLSSRAPAEQRAQIASALAESGEWRGEVWAANRDGSARPCWLSIATLRDEAGAVRNFVSTITDLTEVKRAEERIQHLAQHDLLTRLPNRLLLEARLEQAMAMARHDGHELAVLVVDLDRFKNINDMLGHHVGDAMLVEVARRLRDAVRDGDIVARPGGDEFVLVLTGLGRHAAAGAASVADKLLVELGRAHRVADRDLHTSPSIGIAIFPGDGDDTETLLKNADAAMYHAKSNGRNNRQFFAPKLNADTAERVALEAGLRTAIERHQFALHYQPQVDLGTGVVVGVEALLRWTHPELGHVPPLKFIAVAEDSGQIGTIGAWVLDQALAQLARWRAAGHAQLRVAVNMSALQLKNDTIVNQVADALQRHGLPGSALEMEVTESAAMHDPNHTIALLRRLRALGVALAIDDFGTGYSSMAYLKQLPLSSLKLDRSFVMDIEHDPNDAAISAATIQLAHALGLAVVAEGVESAAQLDFLRGLDCDMVQGYHISRPMPTEACSRFLDTARDAPVRSDAVAVEA